MHNMSFSLLPRELVLTIAENLDSNFLNALLRTCSSLANLLTPLLRLMAFEPRGEMPAIVWAAGRGHEPLVRFLLDEGVNIESVFEPKPYPLGSYNYRCLSVTALQAAVAKGDEATTKLLISRGANIGVFNSKSLLHLAVRSNNPAMVRLILKHGGKHININAGDKPFGRTALHLAMSDKTDGSRLGAAEGSRFLDLSIGAILLEHGADMFAAETHYHASNTPGHLAAAAGNVAGVELLLDNGFPIDMQTIHGDTLLHMAAQEGNVDVARMLLDRGADVTIKQAINWTALGVAKAVMQIEPLSIIGKKYQEVIEFLEAEMALKGLSLVL